MGLGKQSRLPGGPPPQHTRNVKVSSKHRSLPPVHSPQLTRHMPVAPSRSQRPSFCHPMLYVLQSPNCPPNGSSTHAGVASGRGCTPQPLICGHRRGHTSARVVPRAMPPSPCRPRGCMDEISYPQVRPIPCISSHDLPGSSAIWSAHSSPACAAMPPSPAMLAAQAGEKQLLSDGHTSRTSRTTPEPRPASGRTREEYTEPISSSQGWLAMKFRPEWQY